MFAFWCLSLVALVGQDVRPSQPPASTRATEAVDAKAKLESLRKQLPAILKKEELDRGTRLVVCRCTGPDTAKIACRVSLPDWGLDTAFVFYLKFYDGVWTIIRCEAPESKDFNIDNLKILMLDIDEAAGRVRSIPMPMHR